MKYLLSICFIFINCTILYSQDLLSGIQGIKNDNGEMLFEVSGYTISVYEMKGSVEDAGMIRMVEKSYGLVHLQRTYTDSTLRMKNKIVESLIDTPDLPVQISQKCFLLQKDDKTVTVLYLETSVKRDFVLEKEILHLCLDGRLAESVSDERSTRYMILARKKIHLAYEAKKLAPNRIVHGESQISWSEFSSKSRANQYVENQMAIDKADNVEFIKEEYVDVFFDGVPVTARRVIFYDPSNLTDTDYLIVYYVMVQLRGRYVGCILSHYKDNIDQLHIPAFLHTILTITSSTKLISSAESSDKERVYEEANEEYNSYLFEFQFSSWMPIGNLRNVFTVAPTIGAYVCFPIRQKFGIDVGLQLGFPLESNFEYYGEGTEATSFLGFNLRGRYRGALSRNVVYFYYLGMGANWLFTDIESGYNEEYDSYDYYKVAAFDMFGGFNIRYKKIGGFIEYHFTPYGNSGAVKHNIGHSSINLGISFAIPY
ncbi:MAG: hypothetical protein LBV72_05940 [Tannerella sp.]|jgi:hypothetical protein|nr:hypothetical protein [Tannerella sp.]